MKKVVCALCGSDKYELKYEAKGNHSKPRLNAFLCTSDEFGRRLRIVACVDCGHVYANPTWTELELREIYEQVKDELYLQEESTREKTFEERLDFIESLGDFEKVGPLVDVGTYTGTMVKAAKDRGYEAIGVEPSDWGVKVGRGRKLKMKKGMWEKVNFPKESLGVITMWDAIEHMLNPVISVKKAYDLLKPGGLLVIHTIDRDGMMARMMGSKWPWWMDMHVNYFSKTSLEELVEKSGFNLVWSGNQGRYLRLSYLADRIRGMNSSMGEVMSKIVGGLGLGDKLVKVNTGDLVTVCGMRQG